MVKRKAKDNIGVFRVWFIVAVIFISGQSLVYADDLHLGLAWVGKAGMSNRVTKGMFEQLKKIAPSIKIEDKRELASTDELSKVVGNWKDEKDAMVIIRSNGAKWLTKNPPSIPTFTGGHTHPRILGIASIPNVTGVTYHLSKRGQFMIFKRMLPKFDSVLLLLEKGHPSSAVDQQETKKSVEAIGVQYNEYLAADKQDLIDTVTKWSGKVDAIILGNQALVSDASKEIVKHAGDTAVISYGKKAIVDGALGGFVPDDVVLGRMLADSIVDVLINKVPIDSIQYKKDPDPIFFVNRKTLERLGITLPKALERRVQFTN